MEVPGTTAPVTQPGREPPAQECSFGQHQLKVVTVKNHPIPTLYALVIGIDNYSNLRRLTGATNDADTINDFLVHDLGVPPPHIINLREAKATRGKIIDAFRELRDNPHIKPGSPILIYFAGHGGAVEASAQWKERYKITGKIEVIFPYDYGETCKGKVINCIPDKTIAWLLNKLAEAKGNNVTVIFDSCHSASGSRVPIGAGKREARVPDPEVRLEIPVDIDSDILQSVSDPTPSAPRYIGHSFSTHQASHVHLAACGSNEYAWEVDGRGEFTVALLKTIRAHGVSQQKSKMLRSAPELCFAREPLRRLLERFGARDPDAPSVFRSLRRGSRAKHSSGAPRLPYLAKQTPHCYGAHSGRTLFDGCVASRNIAFVPVLYDPGPDNKTLTLQAGVASGVTVGSVWELRRHPILSNEGMLGEATADLPKISQTELKPDEGKADEFWRLCQSGPPCEGGKTKLYARLVKSGPGKELQVWFSPEAKTLLFPKLGDGDSQAKDRATPGFAYAADSPEDSADMLVKIYKPAEGNSGPTQTPPTQHSPQPEPASLGEVETVLFAVARWNWYLQYTNDNHTSALVEMKMFKIAEKRMIKGKYSNQSWQQVPKSERDDMSGAGVVDFEVHEKNLYAIQLKSEVNRPLYVRMFYFDMVRFSITDEYRHNAANGRPDPVFKNRGELTIGDDVEGGTPLPFLLDPGDTVDVGCMKVFWSTDPLELDNIAQDSPFDSQRKLGPKLIPLGEQEGDWGTTGLLLVQRKPLDHV